MFLTAIGVVFIILAVLMTVGSFFVARSRCRGGAPLLDGYIIPPLMVAAGLYFLHKGHYSYLQFAGAYVCSFIPVAILLECGRRRGK